MGDERIKLRGASNKRKRAREWVNEKVRARQNQASAANKTMGVKGQIPTRE